MATQAEIVQGGDMEIGRTIGRAFSTIGSNPGVTLGIAFLFSAVPSTILNLLTQRIRPAALDADSMVAWFSATIVTALITMLLQLITQGALMRATVRAAAGDRANFADSAMTGLRAALPLLGLGILSALGIFCGIILLIVPGVILWVIWSVAGPALVAERLGPIEAMSRSAGLTKGARWKVFAVQVLMLIFAWIVGAALTALLVTVYGGLQPMTQAMSGGGLPVTWIVLNALVTTVISAISAIVLASLYIELREWKEGPAIDHLAQVFA